MTKAAELYGGSLYELAAEEGKAASMMEDLSGLEKIFRENPEYPGLLLEPSIARAERISLIDQAFKGQVETYVLNFLKILCEEGLIREFSGCVEAFRKRYYKDNNIAEASVISAVPLDQDRLAALKAKLEKISGRTIVLTEKVDPSVIGGIRIEMEGRLFDGTAASRIAAIRKQVTEIIV